MVLPAKSILKRFDVDTRPLKLGDYDGGKTKVLSTHKMLDHWGTTWSKEAGGHYLNTQDVLPFRTPAEVRENVRFIIKTLGEGGGYVLSTVHNIQEQVPPENIVAMFEACLSTRN